MPRERSARGWFIVFAVAAFLLYCTLGATGQRPAQKVLNITVGDYSIEQTAKAKDVVVARLGKPGMPVLSFEAMAESDWAKLTKDAASDQPMQAERSYRILSAVGPFLSVEEEDDCDCGGAHPSSSKRFRAFDLGKSSPDSPAPLSLTDIFPEAAVFAALRSDRLVASALQDPDNGAGSPPPASLSELLQAIQSKPVRVGECSYYFSPDAMTNFAFYSAEATDVSVRISLSHASEVCRGQMTQIGIHLPIPASLQTEFDAAKEGKSGFLMAGARRVAAAAETSFTFATKNYGK